MTKQNEVHDNDYYCGAKTRASGGRPCMLRAGFGTNHVGEGRCKFHGGASTGPKNNKKNKNAIKHGLFAKHIPAETLEIIDSLDMDGLEMLWDNIKIQYAAIIRAQNIMVHDDYEKFLNSQARAMTNLTNMIMKYEDLCKSDLATEEQLLRIEKLKVEIEGNVSAENKLQELFGMLNEAISE